MIVHGNGKQLHANVYGVIESFSLVAHGITKIEKGTGEYMLVEYLKENKEKLLQF